MVMIFWTCLVECSRPWISLCRKLSYLEDTVQRTEEEVEAGPPGWLRTPDLRLRPGRAMRGHSDWLVFARLSGGQTPRGWWRTWPSWGWFLLQRPGTWSSACRGQGGRWGRGTLGGGWSQWWWRTCKRCWRRGCGQGWDIGGWWSWHLCGRLHWISWLHSL